MMAKKFLPFHQEAAGKSWEEIDEPVQNVIITILRISGLGFFMVFLLMTVFPIVNFYKNDLFIKFMIPVMSILFCTGLFIFNLILFRKTKARTPWKGSLMILIALLICLILSIL